MRPSQVVNSSECESHSGKVGHSHQIVNIGQAQVTPLGKGSRKGSSRIFKDIFNNIDNLAVSDLPPVFYLGQYFKNAI